jgi:hypothetical protein
MAHLMFATPRNLRHGALARFFGSAFPEEARPRPRAGRRLNGESGFALLIVLLPAVVIGITWYSVQPSVAFQAQRQYGMNHG